MKGHLKTWGHEKRTSKGSEQDIKKQQFDLIKCFLELISRNYLNVIQHI